MTAMNIASSSLTYFLHLDDKTLDAIRVLYPNLKFEPCVNNKLPEKQTVQAYFTSHKSICYSKEILTKLRLPVFITTNKNADISPPSVSNARKKVIYETIEIIFGITYDMLRERLDDYFKSLAATKIDRSSLVIDEISSPHSTIYSTSPFQRTTSLQLFESISESDVLFTDTNNLKHENESSMVVPDSIHVIKTEPILSENLYLASDITDWNVPSSSLKSSKCFVDNLLSLDDQDVVSFKMDVSDVPKHKREGLSDNCRYISDDPQYDNSFSSFHINGQLIDKTVFIKPTVDDIKEVVVESDCYDNYNERHFSPSSKIEKYLQLLDRLGPNAAYTPKVTAWIDDQLLHELKKY